MKMFWSHYSYYVYCTKVHFMEHALFCGISLLREGRFDEARLCIEPFEKLRPLLLLAGWDLKPDNAEYRDKLIRLLWPAAIPTSVGEDGMEDRFNVACNDLGFVLESSRWAAAQIMKFESAAASGAVNEWNLTNEIMKLIPNHSLPFVLSRCIENVSPAETIGRIKSNTSKSMKGAVSQDVVLMQSYEVLHTVLLFMTSAAEGQDLKMEDVPEKVRSIKSCWEKIALLQEMFCTLFLKDESSGDFIATSEKCAILLSVLATCVSDISVDDNNEKDKKSALALARLKSDVKEAQSRYLFASTLYEDGSVTADGVELPSVFVRMLLADPNDLLAMAVQFGDYDLADKIRTEFGDSLSKDLVDVGKASKVVDESIKVLNSCNESNTSAPLELATASKGSVVADVAFQTVSNEKNRELLKATLEKVISEEDKSYARVVSLMDAMVSSGGADSSAAEAFVLYSGKFAQSAEEQVRLMNAKASLDAAVKTLMCVHSDSSPEESMKSIAEMQKALEGTKADGFDCIGMFLDYVSRVTNVIKESKLPTYFGVLSKRPDELIRDLVFYNHNYKTASQLADLFYLDLDSILIEEVAGKINESCFAEHASTGSNDSCANNNDDKMIYHFAAYLGEKWPNLSTLMTLLKSPSDEFHPKLIGHALKCAQDGTPLGAWVKQQRQNFELFYKVFCCGDETKLDDAGIDFATLETPIKVSKRGAEALRSLYRWDENFLEHFYCCIVDELCERGMAMEALKISDEMMPKGAPDYLLEKVASSFVSPQESWKYIERIKDPLKAGALALKFVHSWDDISVCL